MIRKILIVALGLTLWSGPLAQAAPVSETEQIPVDIRRTTFITNDTEKSLKLYRDALGLKVIYDQMINSPMENGETRQRRLVLMRANDDFIGAVGLLEYIHPKKPQRQEKFDEPVPGDPIVVINAKDLDKRWDKVAASPGVTVIESPEIVHYPRANGGKIAVNVSMIRDPDGYWLEINQILDEPASEKD
ncbi:VOC family protein [Aestuariibacter sp. A3R04]|uniref:VOC family protein n=1 Tax=Aestuariibacter sp. A3R04 TaxID=2841571 RepID=UPI001C08E296|nr:VOC family protein [Aestuariibacter sp. A3R04]MBU3023530.1 VOC family protein [Aestuariibacter sp. A3R04]